MKKHQRWLVTTLLLLVVFCLVFAVVWLSAPLLDDRGHPKPREGGGGGSSSSRSVCRPPPSPSTAPSSYPSYRLPVLRSTVAPQPEETFFSIYRSCSPSTASLSTHQQQQQQKEGERMPLMPIAMSSVCPQSQFDMRRLQKNASSSNEGALQAPADGQAYCELALLHAGVCWEVESARDCILRLGPAFVGRHIAHRCAVSEFFLELLRLPVAADAAAAVSEPEAATANVSSWGGMIPEAMTESPPPPSRRPHSNHPVQQQGEQKNNESTSVVQATTEVAEDDGEEAPFVPPHLRPQGHHIPWRPFPHTEHFHPERMKLHCLYNRLTMGIPLENIVPRVERNKLFDVYPLQPLSFPISSGAHYDFGSNDEGILREAQKRSLFAITHRRACWTAQRHYDALASGVIPLFTDLHLVRNAENDLPMYPVDLVMQARSIPGVTELFDRHTRLPMYVDAEGVDYVQRHKVYNLKGRTMPKVDLPKLDTDQYFALAKKLLEYTRANLTTIAVASHFLRAMDLEPDVRRVLIYPHHFLPEVNTLIHGLASLGIDVYTFDGAVEQFRKMPRGLSEAERAAMRERVFPRGFRGAGHSYGMRAPRSRVHGCGEDRCLSRITAKFFDLVVYSVSGPLTGDNSVRNDHLFPHLEKVREHYGVRRVAWIDGEDAATSFAYEPEICELGRLFTRERLFERN